MEWVELGKEDAEKLYNQYVATGSFLLGPSGDTAGDYAKLRARLRSCTGLREDLVGLMAAVDRKRKAEAEQGKPEASSRVAYRTDLFFGLDFYEILNRKYGMTPRAAASEGVWRCLSVCVVPDLVEKRYGKNSPDRFWRRAKRIWLENIWWYMHLSWQGSREATLDVLKNNTTDEVLQLVDRCGQDGYRVDLYREIMRVYGALPQEERRNHLFRRVLMLNTAYVQVLEPSLTAGGNSGYVRGLFEAVKPKGGQK